MGRHLAIICHCFPSSYHENTVNLFIYQQVHESTHNPKRITFEMVGLCVKMGASAVNKGVNTKIIEI